MTRRQRLHGPAARMRCRRCGQIFTVRPGRLIAHDRRQGAVYVHCDGVLAADVIGESADAVPGGYRPGA